MSAPDRETVARVIDPSSWRVLDSYLERVKRHHPHGGYDPDNFTDKVSLAKADTIIALWPTGEGVSGGVAEDVGGLVEAARRIVNALNMAGGQGDALGEAFIWEPPIERRPLITFADLSALSEALRLHAAPPSSGGEA